MSDEQDAEAAQIAAATEPEKDQLTIINGRVEITAVKIDGSTEQVKVRQLPVRFRMDWGKLQSEEAELVELLCDKQNRNAAWNIRNKRAIEAQLLQLLGQAQFEQINLIEQRLDQTREALAKHESAEHWSDSLTDESIIKIIELGDRLNRSRFNQWTERMTKSIEPTMKSIIESLLSKLQP